MVGVDRTISVVVDGICLGCDSSPDAFHEATTGKPLLLLIYCIYIYVHIYTTHQRAQGQQDCTAFLRLGARSRSFCVFPILNSNVPTAYSTAFDSLALHLTSSYHAGSNQVRPRGGARPPWPRKSPNSFEPNEARPAGDGTRDFRGPGLYRYIGIVHISRFMHYKHEFNHQGPCRGPKRDSGSRIFF